MRFKKFYCKSCSNQFWSCSQTVETYCVHCGKANLYVVDKEFVLPFTDTIETGPSLAVPTKRMSLSEFSDKLTRYEMDLHECPFCRETRHLIIHQQQVCDDDLDPDEYEKDMNQYVIECEECGVIMKSTDYFPTMDDDYEKLDKYVADLCQQWDMRGEDIPDDE